MKRLLLALVILAGLGYGYQQRQGHAPFEPVDGLAALPALAYQSGLSIERMPLQGRLPAGAGAFRHGDYTLTPLSSFQVEARVLGAERYRRGREADLSPVDLALGWGPMARDAVLKDIRIRQSGRFYYWRVDQFPIPRRDIETHSANMHFIPADAAVKADLLRVQAGDRVRFKGYLVRADAPDGWRWVSSLTRNDTGNGACELVWVDAIDVF